MAAESLPPGWQVREPSPFCGGPEDSRGHPRFASDVAQRQQQDEGSDPFLEDLVKVWDRPKGQAVMKGDGPCYKRSSYALPVAPP